MKLAHFLPIHESPIGNVYPVCHLSQLISAHRSMSIDFHNGQRFTLYMHARYAESSRLPERWKVWDDISALANHNTIKRHLLACLKAISEMRGIIFRDHDVRFHHRL